MKRNQRLFSTHEIELLAQNPYTLKVTAKQLLFTAEFKRRFWEQYERGVNVTQVFQNLGYDPNVVGISRMRGTVHRLQQAVDEGRPFTERLPKYNEKRNQKLFSAHEIELLAQNPYTYKVTARQLIFTAEFKRRFWEQYERGEGVIQIFQNLGYDPNVVGFVRMCGTAQGLRKIVEKGRPFTEWSLKYKKKPSENYLKQLHQSMEFLKKLLMQAKGEVKPVMTVMPSQNFELIRETLLDDDNILSLKELCGFTGISYAKYQTWLKTDWEQKLADVEAKLESLRVQYKELSEQSENEKGEKMEKLSKSEWKRVKEQEVKNFLDENQNEDAVLTDEDEFEM